MEESDMTKELVINGTSIKIFENMLKKLMDQFGEFEEHYKNCFEEDKSVEFLTSVVFITSQIEIISELAGLSVSKIGTNHLFLTNLEDRFVMKNQDDRESFSTEVSKKIKDFKFLLNVD